MKLLHKLMEKTRFWWWKDIAIAFAISATMATILFSYLLFIIHG